MNKVILQKLALERCRIHVSQVCAILHLGQECEGGINHHSKVPDSLHNLFETIHRDLALLEELVIEEEFLS